MSCFKNHPTRYNSLGRSLCYRACLFVISKALTFARERHLLFCIPKSPSVYQSLIKLTSGVCPRESRERERAPRYGLTVTHGHARCAPCVYRWRGAPHLQAAPTETTRGEELRFHTTWLMRFGEERDDLARGSRKRPSQTVSRLWGIGSRIYVRARARVSINRVHRVCTRLFIIRREEYRQLVFSSSSNDLSRDSSNTARRRSAEGGTAH